MNNGEYWRSLSAGDVARGRKGEAVEVASMKVSKVKRGFRGARGFWMSCGCSGVTHRL